MDILTRCLALFGALVLVCYALGEVDIGNFRMYYSADPYTCVLRSDFEAAAEAKKP